MWAAVSALSLAVQLALCVFNFFSFILFLSKLNDDDDDQYTVNSSLKNSCDELTGTRSCTHSSYVVWTSVPLQLPC